MDISSSFWLLHLATDKAELFDIKCILVYVGGEIVGGLTKYDYKQCNYFTACCNSSSSILQ